MAFITIPKRELDELDRIVRQQKEVIIEQQRLLHACITELNWISDAITRWKTRMGTG